MLMNDMESTVAEYLITPLFILLLISGLIGIITFLFLLKSRKSPGVNYWLIWQLASSFWAFTYAFEFAATDIETKILWSKFSYFGIVYCPISFFLFSLAFSSQDKFLKKKFIAFLFVFGSLFIISPFTNGLHHQHWKSYSIDPATNATDYVYGPLFWIMTLFAYTALFLGSYNIFSLYSRLSKYYRKQITLLFIASLLPPIGNLIYVFQINPLPGFDWTPFTFLVTGIMIAVNISHFKLFDLVPIARNKLIDIIPDAILIVDSSMRIADSNPALRKLINKNENELNGSSVENIFPHRQSVINEIKDQDEFQTELSHEINGQQFYFDMQSVRLADHNQQKSGFLVMLKDITRHTLAEEKIKDSNRLLTSEIQEKEKLIGDLDAFSHTVAHDLQNMLGAIVSASKLIKSGVESMSKAELLEINDLIGLSATKTMHITRELLTLASVRQQEVVPTPVNMHKTIGESVSRLQNLINEKTAQLIIPEHWPEAFGNEAWLEEVWLNYISNALKYGGTPPVIELGNEILSDGRVKFWIKDNGKGLTKSEIEKLFNKFTRLDTLRAEGHGLGLSIVKRIIEKLNGQVGIESDNIDGNGTTFYFILPLVNRDKIIPTN